MGEDMMAMQPEWLLGGLIVFLASAAQSAVGFGYALFATPLLVWLGFPLEHVIALVATCSMIQAMLGAYHLRGQIAWPVVLPATAIRLAALGFGLFGLKRLVGLDQDGIRLTVGVALCLLVLTQWFWRPTPVERVSRGWSALAFVSSGVLAGVLGMGGPPLVLWVMAHRWSPLKSRAFLFTLFALAIPVQLGLMAWVFGRGIGSAILAGLAAFPLVYAGARAGLPVGNRLSRERLRLLAYLLLLLIGLSSVWRGV